nr:DUF87 domain-containing protein [Halostagnicola kamekurae]
MSDEREVVVGEASDGTDVTIPVVELLTGRGFVTGKSGSGKSNTASVIAEELLEAGFPLLIVDTDGEYYGLKEEYEMLHAGADEECDIQIGPEHAEQMATLALEENVPVILDVSGYLDEEVANELLRETARQLFVKEKKLKKPFLLVVEEVHEYIPEGGGMDETGKLLIKIGKRGRKHGLGILGISQRPADVKKDFITQANWLVWHRLTWENDTKVVGRIIDSEYSELVSELDDGQAYVQTDWNDVDVRKIQFRRKRTFDAGATPGLDDFERPELKSVSDALVGDLQKISERKQREESRIEELERNLEKRGDRIEELEEELQNARDISSVAQQMAEALQNPDTVQTELPQSNDEIRRLHDELVELESTQEELESQLEEKDHVIDILQDKLEAQRGRTENLAKRNRALKDRIESLEGDSSDQPIVQAGGDDFEFGYADVPEELTVANSQIIVADEKQDVDELLETTPIDDRLTAACERSRCSLETSRRVVKTLAQGGPLTTVEVADRVDRSTVAVQSLLSELRTQGILCRPSERTYQLESEILEALSATGTDD